MKRLLWWLIAGSRGGENRARILLALKERPFNAHQLAEHLRLDYKTIRHHLKILQENGAVVTAGKEGYGAMFFPSTALEQAWADFDEVWAKVRPREGEA